MSGYLVRHIATDTSTIVTGTEPLTLSGPQGAGLYEIYALSQGARVTLGGAAATVPGAFAENGWSLADQPSAAGDTLALTVAALPDDGGAAISALQYRIGTGSAVTLPGTGTGARTVTVPAGTAASLQLRAVNSIGAGSWSAAKTAVPSVQAVSLAAGGSLMFPDTNGHVAATNLVLRQDIAGMPAPFAADTAFFGVVDMNFVSRRDKEAHLLMGTDNFFLAVFSRDGGFSSRTNKVVLDCGDTYASADLGTLESFLWVAERQGGAIRIGIYATDGSLSEPGSLKTIGNPGHAGFSWSGSELRIGDAGQDAAAPAGTRLDAGGLRRFNGQMDCIGYVSRSVDPSEWQAIAAGADPVAVLGAANLPWYRSFDGSAATLAAPAAATADATSGTAVFGTLAPGGDIRAQSQAKSLLIGNLPVIGHVYGCKKGNGYADAAVPLSGTAKGREGETIEARICYAVDGGVLLDWTPLGTVSGGTWSGSVTCPRAVRGWCYAEVRSTADGATATRRTPFAAGFKLVALGQSQFTIALGGSEVGLEPADRLGLTYVHNIASSPDYGALRAYRLGGDWQSDALARMLDTLRSYGDDTPVMVIRETVNGTSVADFLNDGDNARYFGALTAKTDLLGRDISVVMHQWGTSDINATDYATRHEGLTAASATGYDHCLADAMDADFEYLVLPLTRHNNVSAARIRAQSIAWAEQNGRPVGPYLSDLWMDAWGSGTGAHQDVTEMMGNPNFGAKMGIGLARAVGLDSSENPYFAGAALSSDGLTLTVSAVLPNGGTLYSPEPSRLSQFLVSLDGGASWEQTGYAARLSGGQISITRDDGSAWPVGTLVMAPSDGRGRPNYDPAAESTDPYGWNEASVTGGTLYETYAHDVMGRGLQLMGTRDGAGRMVADWEAEAAIADVSAPAPVLPAGASLAGAASLSVKPYLFSPATGASWIGSADGSETWIVASLLRRVGSSLPLVPAGETDLLARRASNTSVLAYLTPVGSDSFAYRAIDGANRWVMELRAGTPPAGADSLLHGYNQNAWNHFALWKLDPARFDIAAAESHHADRAAGETEARLTLANLPEGSAVFAVAYDDNAAQPLVWNGGSVDGQEVTADYGGAPRSVSVMSGTVSGNATVSVNADAVVVVIVPPR